MMVAPERDTPGLRATACAQPIQNASRDVSEASLRTLLPERSATQHRSPPTARVVALTGSVPLYPPCGSFHTHPATTPRPVARAVGSASPTSPQSSAGMSTVVPAAVHAAFSVSSRVSPSFAAVPPFLLTTTGSARAT